MKKLFPILFLFLIFTYADATTWTKTKLTDPLTGEKIEASSIMSYGSYIYSCPSKYDLVFWPMTDEKFITINTQNGYGAFNNDFEKLPIEFKESLKKWLKATYNSENPPKTHKEKLSWLEKVYGQINKNENFWKYFYRLMAFIHNDEKEKSLHYVKKALSLLDKTSLDDIKGMEKIEALYLLGEYNRRAGNFEKARDYLKRCLNTKYTEKGVEKIRHPYFKKLIEDRIKKMDLNLQELLF